MNPSSFPQIKTIFLGYVVNRLANIDKKLATTLVNLDKLIVETPVLSKIFSKIESGIDPSLKPFLKTSLIEKTMKDTLAAEKLRASNPAYKAMLGDSIRDISAFDDERTYEKFLVALNHMGGTIYGKTFLDVSTPVQKMKKVSTKI